MPGFCGKGLNACTFQDQCHPFVVHTQRSVDLCIVQEMLAKGIFIPQNPNF